MGSGRHPNTSADVSPRVAASCIAKFRRRLPFVSRCVHRRAIAINAHIRSSSNPTAGADSRDISPTIIISTVSGLRLLRKYVAYSRGDPPQVVQEDDVNIRDA